MPQPHRDAFVMYDIREDLAESLDSENRLHPERADATKARSTQSGDYVGTVFQVTAGTSPVKPSPLCRPRERRMEVGGDGVEPSSDPARCRPPPSATRPRNRPRRQSPATPRSSKPPVTSSRRGSSGRSFRGVPLPLPGELHVLQRVPDGERPLASSSAEAGPLIQERLKLLGDFPETIDLEDLLVAADPRHPDLRLVRRDAATAYGFVCPCPTPSAPLPAPQG